MSILIDSNIIIYSITKGSPKKEASRKFIRENQTNTYLSHQVILESLRVLTHPKFAHPMSARKALTSTWRIAKALNIVSPNMETISITKELIKKHKLTSNRIFDAYLVATALSNSIDTIATDNVKHFKIYDEINTLSPF